MTGIRKSDFSAKPSLYWRYAPIYRHPPHHGKTLKKGLDVTLTRQLRYRYPDQVTQNVDALSQLLPDNEAVAGIPPSALCVALREPTAKGAVQKLARLQAPDQRQGPTLDDIPESNPALSTIRMMVDDLKRWKAGACPWQDMIRSMLLYGPPGTGKSYLARAFGNSANAHFVQASFSEWQSTGHLGDFLAAMRKTFADARERKPAILFLDEIDSAGSRFDDDKHARSYRRQTINGLLEEIDLIMQSEGVILIGACNNPNALDPAILRSGRFDRKVEVPRPDKSARFAMLRQALPEDRFSDEALSALARRAAGLTAADLDAALRQAKTVARFEQRTFCLHDLEHQFQCPAHNDELDRRVALHECGHAIVAQALGHGPVQSLVLTERGGESNIESPPTQSLLSDLKGDIACLMAGRAAEALITGEISAGAGGQRGSDLERATELALSIDCSLGLGVHGPVWLGDIALSALRDHDQRIRIRQHLQSAEQSAMAILKNNQPLLERMAKALAYERELTGDLLQRFLQDVKPARPDEPDTGMEGGAMASHQFVQDTQTQQAKTSGAVNACDDP